MKTATNKPTPAPELNDNASDALGLPRPKTDTRSHKIGSYGIGKVNFDKKDHFFHLDENLKKTKNGVRDFVDPDILGLKKSGWNASASVGPGPRLDQRKHLFNIRVGLADAKITTLAPRTCYPGCDDLRKDFAGWNVSNQLVNKEIRAKDDQDLKKALTGSMRRTARTVADWATRGKPYLRPEECVDRLNEQLRKQKEDERILREKILREEVDMAASKERKAALVFRYAEERKRVDAQLTKKKVEKEFTGRPDTSKSLRNSRRYEYYHPGKWMKPKIQDFEMWTCCSSEVKDSRGCQRRVQDRMAWQFT